MVHTIYAFVVAHALVCFYVFSVLVEQLPPPDTTLSKLYRYCYAVVQFLFANWRRSKDAVLLDRPAPPMEMPPAGTH